MRIPICGDLPVFSTYPLYLTAGQIIAVDTACPGVVFYNAGQSYSGETERLDE
ncbi:MAG: hypothetical protein U9R53_02745 [Chloroflexota bacterium]|nr:hypothetical protein [Chloroflexota bacterium]